MRKKWSWNWNSFCRIQRVCVVWGRYVIGKGRSTGHVTFFLFSRFIGLPSFSMASHSQLFINFRLSRPFVICQNSMMWAYSSSYWNVNPSLLTDVIFVWIVEGVDDGWSGCPFVHVNWLSQLVNVALSFKPKDGEKVAQEVVRMQEGQLKRKHPQHIRFLVWGLM